MRREDDRPDTLQRRGLRVRVAWTGAPALDGLGEAAGSGEAAALAINLSDKTLPAGTISIDAATIFAARVPVMLMRQGSVAFTRERDLWEWRDAPWIGAEVRAEWAVPELAPRSSCFATLHKST